MIVYYKGAFNLNLLKRINGSAVYRASFPALLSVIVYLWIDLSDNDFVENFNHPAPISVLVSAISLLYIFRANFGYARYWEACTATFNMQSKWLDASVHSACYHLQCDHYLNMKPPSYYSYPDLSKQFLTRNRHRHFEQDENEEEKDNHPRNQGNDDEDDASDDSSASEASAGSDATPYQANTRSWRRRQQQRHNSSSRNSSSRSGGNASSQRTTVSSNQHVKSIERSIHDNKNNNRSFVDRIESFHEELLESSDRSRAASEPRHLTGKARLDGGWKDFFADDKATHYDARHKRDFCGFASTKGGAAPPLFLQELSHLTSLLSAVALSTLRNDVDGAESPLTTYVPGAPWPDVNPTKQHRSHGNNRRRQCRESKDFVLKWLGMDRTPEERTRFNSLRPLQVLGGVSQGEILFLQAARGPAAKTQLAFLWLSTLIESEHLAGSMGNVESAILSRVMQFLGDGMNAYNQARKIMYIPFPFPHAQLSVFAQFVLILAVPLVLIQYTNETWLGATLSFCTVACLSGLHEVARELENPFRNVPNDIPVCTLQAMFNESLITMYAGCHPDAYFDVSKEGRCHKRGLRRSLYKRHSGSIRLQRQDTDGQQQLQQANDGEEGQEGDLQQDVNDKRVATTAAAAAAAAKLLAESAPSPTPEDEITKLRQVLEQQSQALKDTNSEIEQLIQLTTQMQLEEKKSSNNNVMRQDVQKKNA